MCLVAKGGGGRFVDESEAADPRVFGDVSEPVVVVLERLDRNGEGDLFIGVGVEFDQGRTDQVCDEVGASLSRGDASTSDSNRSRSGVDGAPETMPGSSTATTER